jgi:hypothetical protein
MRKEFKHCTLQKQIKVKNKILTTKEDNNTEMSGKKG